MEQKPLKTKDRQYYMFALRIASDFGATIAVPVVVLVYFGRLLDHKYNSGIIMTIVGFVLAALISGKIIYSKAKRYGKEYQSLIDKKS